MRVLLRGARVVPLGAGGTEPGLVDVRVVDDRIREVGPGLTAGRHDEVVDLDGRWLIPGLWDAHAHVGQWATSRERLDVSSATSPAEAADLVTERLRREPPPDGMLVGYGYRDVLWDTAPTPEVLDEAAARAGRPDVGVVLVCGDLHSGWLSTVAARQVGVPAGVVRETSWFAAIGQLDPDEPTLDGWVAKATAAAAARGLVGVVDFDLADNLASWQRRMSAGIRDLRVEAGVWPEHLDGVLARELATGDLVGGEATGGLLAQGPLKVISDGSLNTRTAYCHAAYAGFDGPTNGVLNVPPENLVPLMAKAARGGVHAAIHAIGDRANALALDAFAASGAQGSIEHAQLLDFADLPRFVDLGVAASIQPEHLADDRDAIDDLWADRADRCYSFRSLHEAGVRLMLGSDAPVAPLEPWFAISSAVTRTRDGRPSWHPEQTISAQVALAASVRSRVAPGQVADLVVLDADPLSGPGTATVGVSGGETPDDPAALAEYLRTMPVAATMLAGRFTHQTI